MASSMCRLPSSSTLPTLRHWSWIPSRRTTFVTRTRRHEQLWREWHQWLLKQWLIDVCGVSGRNMWTSRRFSSSFYFSIIQTRSHRPFDLIFLPFLSRLCFLEIYLGLTSGSADDFEILASLMGSLSISLTSPVEFNIRFRGCNNFNPNTFYENLRNACSRLRLDSVATHPTISQLRVDININGAFHCEHDDGPGVEPDKDKVLKAVLSGLSSLCVKGILFVKAVRGEWYGLDAKPFQRRESWQWSRWPVVERYLRLNIDGASTSMVYCLTL